MSLIFLERNAKFFLFGSWRGNEFGQTFPPKASLGVFLGCHVRLAGNLPASQWSLSLIIVVITELYRNRNIITQKTNTSLPQAILLH